MLDVIYFPHQSTLHCLLLLCSGLWFWWNIWKESLALTSGINLKEGDQEMKREWAWDIYSFGFLFAGSLLFGCVPLLKAKTPVGKPPLLSYALSSGNCLLLVLSEVVRTTYFHQLWATIPSLYLILLISKLNYAIRCLMGLWLIELWLCISFLRLWQQITTNLVAQNNRK